MAKLTIQLLKIIIAFITGVIITLSVGNIKPPVKVFPAPPTYVVACEDVVTYRNSIMGVLVEIDGKLVLSPVKGCFT